jgi:uncharacterized membrane protein
MNRIHKRDIGWGIFFFLMAVTVWVLVPYQIPVSGRTHMGPRFFPKVISIVMGIMSLGLVLNTLVTARKDTVKNKDAANEVKGMDRARLLKEGRAVIAFFFMLVGAFLMPKIGFIISSFIMSGLILYVLNARKWYYYGIMGVSVLVIYYVFKYQLYVQLP